MPAIEISDENFARLQRFAAPLVDSADTALAKVLDLAESGVAHPTAAAVTPGSANVGGAIPDLTHTTVRSAKINGKVLSQSLCNWNAIMMEAVRTAAKSLPKPRDVAELIVVNYVAGKKEGVGFKYVPEAGISIQGQNANKAWLAILHLAQSSNLQVEVTFAWGAHPKAHRPGQVGRVTVGVA